MDEHLVDGFRFLARPDTSDYNSFVACAVGDEYGLRDWRLEGKVVFDIGAHVGGVAVLAASLGASVVVAVEPVPENAEIIRANAELNGLSIQVLEAAAGAPGGTTISYGWHVAEGADKDEPTATAHAFIANTGIGAEEGYEPSCVISVPTVTLQELVDRYGVPYLVKLDCEGGEWPLLAEPIAAEVEVFTGEYHPWIGDAFKDQGSYFTDNRAEVERRLGASHTLRFHGPGGIDAGYFVAERRR